MSLKFSMKARSFIRAIAETEKKDVVFLCKLWYCGYPEKFLFKGLMCKTLPIVCKCLSCNIISIYIQTSANRTIEVLLGINA